MSLSFLPSYLRTLLEAEVKSAEEEYDLQETIDEQSDWVLVDFRNEASKRKQSDDDLLQDYVVIEGQENGRKEDDSSLDVGVMVRRGSEHNSLRKAARRARKRAKRASERQSSYLGVPFKFIKLPVNPFTPRWSVTDVVPTVKVNPSKERLSSSIPLIKPYETQLHKGIVPFHGEDQVHSSEVLRVFQDLSKKSSSAIFYCDFAQLNALNVCTTRDLVCVKNSHQTSCAVNSPDNYMLSHFMTHNSDMFFDIVTRDQCMWPGTVARDQCMFPRMLIMDMPVLENKLELPFREAVENDDEDVFEDCIYSTSQIFSLSTASESFYSTFYTTKKTFEDLLKSLLLLHLFVGKKLQSWKNATMSNITQLSTGHVIPVATITPHYVTKSSVTVSDKLRGHANRGYVTGKQLRRQNRTTVKNNVVNSNRQRGMKCGRFQNNVGNRESWH